MDISHVRLTDANERVDPKLLLEKIEFFNRTAGTSFKQVLGALTQVQDEIRRLDQLKEVAQAAEHVLRDAQVGQAQDTVETEILEIMQAIEQAVAGLQVLDRERSGETIEAKQLAIHLDLISRDNNRLQGTLSNYLQTVLGGFVAQDQLLQQIQAQIAQNSAGHRDGLRNIEQFMESLSQKDDHAAILQEALDFIALNGQLMMTAQQEAEKVNELVEMAATQTQDQMNSATDIRNILQQQVITHQKVDRVIDLLNKIQLGLLRISQMVPTPAEPDNTLEMTEPYLEEPLDESL